MTPATATRPATRVPFLFLGAACLALGLWSGLLRLGAVGVAPVGPLEHGPLMVSGFLGTVIALERAVAARARWAFAGPALCGVGALALALGHHVPGAALLSLGAAVAAAALLQVLFAHPALHHAVLAVSGLFWLAGNLLLAAGRPVYAVVPLWLVFLVGTIAAERLELNRLMPTGPKIRAAFVAALLLLVGGGAYTLVDPALGMRALGLGALGLAAWLLAHDIARRTIRQEGQVRYIAASLLGGYAWLAVGGALAVWLGHPVAGPRYDALLHALLVGFVFSMIFGHALVILPAVAGVRVPFKPRFYAHLVLLHASLAARVLGDFSGDLRLRQAAAWAGVAAIALFLASTLAAALGSKRAQRAPAAPSPPPVPQKLHHT